MLQYNHNTDILARSCSPALYLQSELGLSLLLLQRPFIQFYSTFSQSLLPGGKKQCLSASVKMPTHLQCKKKLTYRKHRVCFSASLTCPLSSRVDTKTHELIMKYLGASSKTAHYLNSSSSGTRGQPINNPHQCVYLLGGCSFLQAREVPHPDCV